MRRTLVVAVAFVGAAACSPPTTVPPTPPPPPQVVLTVNESYVIGPKISGTTSVSGCKSVTQVVIQEVDGSFITDANYKANPSKWEIPSALLNRFYSARGFAVPLTLVAKLSCDDGRVGTSQPVGVTFFPVASVVTSPMGGQMLPDAFVAEGGLGGSATTFIGCTATATGRALARVDTQGQIIAMNAGLPFDCTYNSTISDKNLARGTRWLMEPGAGAFAFDSNLNITATVPGEINALGVSSDGDAILWDQSINVEKIIRATPLGGANAVVWKVQFPALMIASPVVDTGNGWVYGLSWQFQMGTGVGNFVMIKYNYANGLILNADTTGHVPAIISQNFGTMNRPITPSAAFNTDGTIVYAPLTAFDMTRGITTTTVVACATATGGCSGASRRWTSATFDSALTVVLPFSNGNNLAIAGGAEVYFLSAANGQTKNLGNTSLRPEGSLVVQGIQPGAGADFYVLSGIPASHDQTFPSEIIATDAPENGELWRLQAGSGESPLSGLYIAVDEGGQPWVRMGLDQIKPLKLSDYRTARGATPDPSGP